MIKVILGTFITSVVTVAIIATLFIDSILAGFNLVAISVEQYNNLQNSKVILEKIKKRHDVKKRNVSNKFITKPGKRLAVTAASAAALGTVGVVTLIFTLEAKDYCNQKGELINESNILFNEDRKFSNSQCFIEAKNDSKELMGKIVASISDGATELWVDAQDISISAWKGTKGRSIGAWKGTKRLGSNAWSYSIKASDGLRDSVSDIIK